MFVSEISHGCSLDYWTSNSQIAHAVSEGPAGPYRKVATALNAWAHEPQLVVNPAPAAAGENKPGDTLASRLRRLPVLWFVEGIPIQTLWMRADDRRE
jgi:hypothetical protein